MHLPFVIFICAELIGLAMTFTIHCPLIWTTAVVGENIPLYSINSGSDDIFVARALSGEGNYIGGFFRLNYVFINDLNGKSVNVSDYEILTNPHECITEWIPWQYQPPHQVPIYIGSDKYLGRGWETNQFLSGTAASGTFYYTTADGSSPKTAEKYDILRSYSKGLSLQSDSFVFDENPFQPTKAFMGIDEIHNGGDTYVRQIVTQSRRVKETSKISSSKFWGVIAKATVSISASIAMGNSSASLPISAGITGEIGYRSENSEEMYDEKETEITVTKEVLVAPFTSVQICSTVSLAEEFQTSYVARGVYTAPGLSSEEIISILRTVGKYGIPDGRGGVITQETGTFSGNLAVTTQFIVLPYDSAGGCSEIQRKIQELRRDRKNKLMTTLELSQRWQEIDDIIERRNISFKRR